MSDLPVEVFIRCLLPTHSTLVTFLEKGDTPLNPLQEIWVSCTFLGAS